MRQYFETITAMLLTWIDKTSALFLVLIALYAILETKRHLRASLRLVRVRWHARQLRKLVASTILMFSALGPGGYYFGEMYQYFAS